MQYNKTKQKKIIFIILLIFFILFYLFLYEKKTNSYQTDTLCIRFSSINNVCLKDELLFYECGES